jgi:NTE family protein
MSMSEKTFSTGSLRQALAASVAIPGLIGGPTIDGMLMVDGGVVNPVPFDILKPRADIVIAIDVTGRPSSSKRKHHSNMELGIGGMLIAFHQIAVLKRKIAPPDYYFEPALEKFQAHDFFHIGDILKAAKPSRDALKRTLEDVMNCLVKSGA